jgi:hypothetical protein
MFSAIVLGGANVPNFSFKIADPGVFALVLWSLSAGYFPQAYPDQPAGVYWMAGSLATVLFFLSVVTHEPNDSLRTIRSGIEIPKSAFHFYGAFLGSLRQRKCSTTPLGLRPQS